MAPGDTMQGVRCPDVDDPTVTHPRLAEGGYRREAGVWHVRPPGCEMGGSIAKHDVTEHEDGTITVKPSILLSIPYASSEQQWHGYLERGVWREV